MAATLPLRVWARAWPLDELGKPNASGLTDALENCELYGASIYTKVLGSIIFVVVWPFIVLDMKWFPLGRPAAALVGAAFMVVFNVVSQTEVYEIQGEIGDMQTIFLLVGMMMLCYYFDREGLLRLVALRVFGGADKPFKHILWKVSSQSYLLYRNLRMYVTKNS